MLSRMPFSEIGSKDGYAAMLALLDERFRRPDDSRAFEAFEAAVTCGRAAGQSLDSFLHEFGAT